MSTSGLGAEPPRRFWPVASEVGKSELLAAAVAYRQAAFDRASQADRLADFARRSPPV